MSKLLKVKRKMEQCSYQMTAKKGLLPTMLKSVAELQKTFDEMDVKKKKFPKGKKTRKE